MPLRVISIVIALALTAAGHAEARDDGLWKQYKRTFLSDDGRIVDHAQDKTSHSEGQGYGMWLAVLHNDRAAFDRIWQWTRNNLRVRSDNLFAWHWGKRPDDTWQVLDYNNATDGDVLIAYALLLASESWNDRGYRDAALPVISDMRRLLAVDLQGRTYLLPGYFGFAGEDSVVLNPSYLIFPAFRAFGRADQPTFWDKVVRDGLNLVERSCFGSFCLPADWVELTGDRIVPAPGKDPYFGAAAVRVLLALASEDASRFPKGVSRLLDLYRKQGSLPLWVDLARNSASLEPAYAGYYAIYSLAARKLGERTLAQKLLDEARTKLTAEKNAYYSYSLFLLATAGQQAP